MNLQERADLYQKAFPKFPPLSVVPTSDGGNRIEGVWFMGQNYTVKSGYYGGYPHGYLDRVMSMFPGKQKILHLFSGKVDVKKYGGTTFDINRERNPHVCGNAEELSHFFMPWGLYSTSPDRNYFDLILADPPYSQEDAEHYGVALISRKKVLRECFEVLNPGGWLIWLDQVFPMFRKDEFRLGMTIGMIKSTNHRVRAVFGFQKVKK